MTNGLIMAQPLSRQDIRDYVDALRQKLKLQDAAYVDIVYLAENVFPFMFSKSGYSFQVIDNKAMGNRHGLTNPHDGTVYIREDVYMGANQGYGRDRMTIAHEIGHFLLHNGIVLGLSKVDPNTRISPCRNPEWQASAFAGEFLMGHNIIKDLTVQQIVDLCVVSRKAAAYQKSRQ